MTTNRFPKGWNEQRVHQVLAHYENQSDEEAVMEDDAAFDKKEWGSIKVPVKLIPVVRQLIDDFLQAAA